MPDKDNDTLLATLLQRAHSIAPDTDAITDENIPPLVEQGMPLPSTAATKLAQLGGRLGGKALGMLKPRAPMGVTDWNEVGETIGELPRILRPRSNYPGPETIPSDLIELAKWGLSGQGLRSARNLYEKYTEDRVPTQMGEVIPWLLGKAIPGARYVQIEKKAPIGTPPYFPEKGKMGQN